MIRSNNSPTKERIDELKAVHVYLSKYSPRELRPLSEDSARQVPAPGVHPLVRTHPENGRKALYLNPVRIESIVGMADEQALNLVSELMEHALQKKYEYRHQWHYGAHGERHHPVAGNRNGPQGEGEDHL